MPNAFARAAPMKLTPEMMAKTPSMKPPPGVIPNFNNPSSENGPGLIATMSVLYGLTLIVVALRFWSRGAIVKKIGLDDWMVLAGTAVVTVNLGLVFDVFERGFLGRHTWDVPLSVFASPVIGQKMLVVGALNPFATYFAKMSIMLLLLRLFPRNAFRVISILTWLGIVLNTIFYFSLLTVNLSVCAPRAPSKVSPAMCTRKFRGRIGEANASINAILDIYVLVISLPTLWKLRMNRSRKVGVMVVLGIGLIACGCSIATWYERTRIDKITDVSWEHAPIVTLGMVEPLVAIISACLPALPALWVYVNKKGVPTLRGIFSKISLSSNRSQTGSIPSPTASSKNSIEKNNSIEKRTVTTYHTDIAAPPPTMQQHSEKWDA